MTDIEPDSNEIQQEIDTFLEDIITDVLPENEMPPAPGSQPNVKKDSPTTSTAERILNILLADARMPISEIANQAEVSKPTVRKYIDQLESKGVIIGYSVDVNPDKLHDQTISLVRMEIDQEVIKEATAALANMEQICSLFSLKEESGAIAEVRADGFNELGKIIDEEFLAIDGVKAAHTTILEERHE